MSTIPSPKTTVGPRRQVSGHPAPAAQGIPDAGDNAPHRLRDRSDQAGSGRRKRQSKAQQPYRADQKAADLADAQRGFAADGPQPWDALVGDPVQQQVGELAGPEEERRDPGELGREQPSEPLGGERADEEREQGVLSSPVPGPPSSVHHVRDPDAERAGNELLTRRGSDDMKGIRTTFDWWAKKR